MNKNKSRHSKTLERVQGFGWVDVDPRKHGKAERGGGWEVPLAWWQRQRTAYTSACQAVAVQRDLVHRRCTRQAAMHCLQRVPELQA